MRHMCWFVSMAVVASVAPGSLLAPRVASAAWPPFGRAIATAVGDQLGPKIAPDGAGGAIVAWLDRRTPALNLYAAHVLASGDLDAGWPVNGRALLTDSLAAAITPEGQEFPAIAPDGAGGAIVSWPDARHAATGLDVYAQHVLASGDVDPAWPVNGAALCAVAGVQNSVVMLADGAGGAFVAWIDGRSNPTADGLDIFAQHVLASGAVDPAWPAGGTPVCVANGAQTGPVLAADGAGGVLVAWYDLRSSVTSDDIYAQHVLGSGTVDPAWPVNGRALCTAPGTQAAPDIVPDGAHGAIVAWHDARDGVNHIYAQHVLASGTIAPGWPGNGLPVSVTGVDEVIAKLVPDGAGGAIVTWGDASAGHHAMRAAHVLGAGAVDPAWPAGGVPLSATPSEQTSQVMAADGAGGAFVVWQVGLDIVAQHVLASGALDSAFPSDGRPVCDLPSRQQNPAIAADGVGGAIVTWMDFRNGVDADVFGLQVLAAGTSGVADPALPGIALAAAPNPARGPLALRFALPRAMPVTLAIYDAAGRRVRTLADGMWPAGTQTVGWDARDRSGRAVPAGLYFARLAADGRVLVRRIASMP